MSDTVKNFLGLVCILLAISNFMIAKKLDESTKRGEELRFQLDKVSQTPACIPFQPNPTLQLGKYKYTMDVEKLSKTDWYFRNTSLKAE